MRSRAAEGILDAVEIGRCIVIQTVRWCQATQKKYNCGNEDADDKKLSKGGAICAEFGPATTGFSNVRFKFFLSELVVEHSDDGNAVAEGLQARDGGSPHDDGESDKKDILEDTAEG